MLNDQVKIMFVQSEFFCLQFIFQAHAVYTDFKRRPSDTFSCFQKKVNVTIALLQVI